MRRASWRSPDWATSAVEGDEPVVLTRARQAVADIVPRRVFSERRLSELLVADLTAISQLDCGRWLRCQRSGRGADH
jgi:antitoxin (DNA-binding transcriptional repressor) of toxin-antitoxin stability system